MSGRSWIMGLLIVALAALGGWPSAQAAGRVALVIGNGGYAERPLRRPPQDAQDMAALLKMLGFTVTVATELDLEQMDRRVQEFIANARAAEVRVFYYSGHGANYQDHSYLLPVDHGINRAYDMKRKAYPLDALLDGLREDAPGGINVVLLDACRDEPFGSRSKSVGGGKGLIPVAAAGSGTLVAYAAGSGEQAMELAGDRNSLFTKHLLQRLREPEEIRLVLTQVRAAVKAENPAQVTETNDKLDQRLYLAGEPGKEPLSITTGTLAIKSSQPPGVVIYVDGARLGEAPQNLEGLPAGKPVTVTAKQAGYEDYREQVWIRAGQRSELNVMLTVRSTAPPPTTVGSSVPDLVAIVNGKPISKAMFNQYAQQSKERTKVDSPEGVKKLVDQLVLEELLVQEAGKQKLADDPQVKQQMEMVQRSLLASTVVRRMLSANAPGEDAIKDKVVNDYLEKLKAGARIEIKEIRSAKSLPDPLAIVNGKPISKAMFDQYTRQLGDKAKVDSPEGVKKLVDQLVMEELLVQEAGKQKLADDPQVKQQMEMVQRNLLASTVVRRMLNANAPSEDAIKKEYETAVAAMKGKEYKASHILVDSGDKAREIIAKLKKGGNFAELAKARSSDSSASNGGDLGWFTTTMMVPPFAEAVAKMSKGRFSEQPVQTPFGWHVILLEDVRDSTPPSLDELKPQITQMLQSRTVNDYLEKLKAVARIEVKE